MSDISVMIDGVKFNYRVGLVIRCNNKILVEVNDKIDFVTLPGGRCRVMESTQDALQREIKEEIGYDLDKDNCKLSGMIENFFNFEDKDYHELYFLYKTAIKEDSELLNRKLVNLDSGKTHFEWIDINDLEKTNLMPKVLKEWINEEEFKHIVIR